MTVRFGVGSGTLARQFQLHPGLGQPPCLLGALVWLSRHAPRPPVDGMCRSPDQLVESRATDSLSA
jgi:hypothetical protein